MTDIANIVAITDSYEEIHQIGIEYQKKTVESILAFSKVVFTLKKKCEDDEHTDFNEKVLKFWGLSSSGASQFAKTGEHSDKLMAYSKSLPASSRTLYELTQLPIQKLDEHINIGDITPSSTVNDVKAIKDTLKETKKANKLTKNKVDDDPFNVEAKDEDGNIVDAELVSDNEDQPTPKKAQKMSVLEALTIFDVDINELYMEHIQAGKDKDLLSKAFYVLTGEKV